MYANIEKVYEILEKYNLDAIIITNPDSMKYFGYDMWFDSIKEWMVKPGGGNQSGSTNMCIISHKDKPVYILSSFSLFFLEGDAARVLPYGNFTTSKNKNIKDIGSEENKKIANILSGRVFVDPYDALEHAVSDLDLKNVRIAVEYDGINRDHKRAIDDKLKGCKVLNGSEVIRLARMVKSDQEIGLIRKCFEITESAFIKTINLINSRATLNELNNSFKKFIESDNAIVQHLSLMQKGLGMTEVGEYRFDNKMIMGFDAGITYENYISDTGLTVFWGLYDKSDLEIYKKLLSIIKSGFSIIRPGIKCLEIFKAMRSRSSELKIENASFEGHGVGLSFREYPFINGRLEYDYNNGFENISANFNIEKSMIINLEVGYQWISWETVKDYYISTCRKNGSNPAAVAVIQTFGDYLSFNPHMHILAADGCFGSDGFFYAPSISIDTASLEKLFIHKIFKMLLKKGLITQRIIDLILSWRHTGFGVYCGKRINPKDARSTENLARYIIRASFSQKRMEYFPDQAKVTYQSKYGKDVKEFSCLEWLAALVSHIPDRGGQTVRYLGYYSNVTRGRLKKEGDKPEAHIIEDDSPGGPNKSWARLIQKIYEVDPLTCPKCGGDMRIIAFIEDYKIVKKILDYVGIYEFGKKRSPPRVNTYPDEFDDYARDDYIDCDHVC